MEVSVGWSKFETGKPYCAFLSGLDRKFTFQRDFLAPIARGYSNSHNTGGHTYELVEDGIYETQASGRKGPVRRYYELANGELEIITREAAIERVKALDFPDVSI